MSLDKAIKLINPNAEFKIDNDNIDNITWLNETTPISKTDIQDKMAELQTEYDNNQYQRDREKEYPTIADQLDDIYHNGVEGWKESIKAVKDKYPKE